jgi:lysozyme family protein
MSDNIFESAMEFVYRYEGGFVNDPDDPGGATNLGISLRFLRVIQPDATVNDIENMDKETATEIYKKCFWKEVKCDKMLSDKLSFIVFDAVVNMGTGGGGKLLQRSLNEFGYGLNIDGKIGNLTLQACNDMYNKDMEDDLVETVLNNREDFYNNLANSKPVMRKFLRGWLNRVNALRDEVL